MSTYAMETKHPVTDKFETATWIDDYFGKHRYGVQFSDGTVIDPEVVELETKPTKGGDKLSIPTKEE